MFCQRTEILLFLDTLNCFSKGLVNIITSDGRSIVGTLKGFDNVINLVVKDSHERVFSPVDGVERVPLGLFIIRVMGDICYSWRLFFKLPALHPKINFLWLP
ncbi:unnamed protein product [Schistocephalus solidus]|uniref:U6 snRNA-associated Sm-like protein LSm8 n=1 Tax=Schistocephalus solidus TaxID=70667 RepID=A0A183TEH1_SCHSO|nr:unnamed protein product [Schistocephalus solidus]